jgi:hypothetical protein
LVAGSVLWLASGRASSPDLAADLRAAAAQGHVEAITDLLARGANVNAADARDWTALHHATIAGHADAARLLLERGADPNFRGQFDLTPLHWAAMKGRAEICALLLRRGARFDAQSLWGMQPLHLTADAKVAAVLFDAGASVTAADQEGATLLHRARNGSVAKAILEKKADIRTRDRAGRTPLEVVVFDENEVKGIVVYVARAAARLRGPSALVPVELFNLTENAISDLVVRVEESVAAGGEARPERVAEFAPGQRLVLTLALTRREGVQEGEYPLAFAVSAGGARLGRIELRLDNSRGQTLEDRGYIRLGKGSIRPAPSRWQYLAYAAGPALLVGALLWLRRRSQRSV